MTQSTRSKKPRPAPRQSPLPAIISALIVIAVFVVLGFVLANTNRAGVTSTGAAPTDAALGYDASAPGAALPTAPVDGAAEPGPAAVNNAKTYSAPPPMTIDPAKNYTATISTPRGDIEVKLRPDLAPQTVNSFVFLSREGFYDGLTWHRVLENFMAQGGDPEGTGGGGPGYNLPDEFTDQISFDRPGLLAMAKTAAPNSAGSQFFITTGPAEWLDGQYTIFGEVTAGQEIVDAIPLRNPDGNPPPAEPGEQILKITVNEQ